jgi:1-aminocyclopropane-1-carboxylate deaminase
MLIPSPLQQLPSSLVEDKSISIWIKRDDLIHPVISGNKYRKLKYNLAHLKEHNLQEVVTFGGAHSNHIDAMAFLGNQEGLKVTGIIRGEEPKELSPTLSKALELGMRLEFVSRSEYRLRNDMGYLTTLQKEHPNAMIIPEGGANELGVRGCEDIVTECQEVVDFDYITVDCGTGATLAGMVRPLKPHQKVIGIQVLKGEDFISPEVHRFNTIPFQNFRVLTDYHFGGYAKYESELIDFMQWFYAKTNIKLDPVYTGKQFYAVFDQIKKSAFPSGSKLVLVHTGGLQGLAGFEKRYGIRIYP